jgi:hypothetical protein
VTRTRDPAYCAGYIDGEGCFQLVGDDTSAQLEIGNTYFWALAGMQRNWGGTLQKRKAQVRCKTFWYWRICGDALRAMIAAILPHLLEKRVQAELLMESYSCPRQSLRRQQIAMELKAMKRINYDFSDRLEEAS